MSLYQEITKALNFLINRPSLTALDVYPVGSIYMSVNSTSPATLFGGTWVALNEGRVLIGAGTAYPAGSTGGEESHALTTAEMPSHSHSGSTGSDGGHSHTRGTMNITGNTGYNAGTDPIYCPTSGAFYQSSSATSIVGAAYTSQKQIKFYASDGWSGSTSSNGSHSHSVSIENTGSGSAHNNMQPYLSVYMWKRTA